ncbi:hypothetical protein [Microbacterium sp. 18062]|uniref:hypothetical protein n=1 Tax=Microbacterium sp. 18062 TaxID=2681410 RepID=UPI00135CE3D4|nr:hypothetical protein [Microbacterium sp. 18062]
MPEDLTASDAPASSGTAPTPSGVHRRTLLKGAAWSAPVILAAMATPAAMASVADTTLAWTGSQTDLLSLRVLSDSSLITASALVTVPTQFTVNNGGAGAVNETATVTIVVGRPTGINLPVGRARGFGVYSLNGAVVAANNTVAYQSAFGIQYGFPITTFTGTLATSIASNGALQVPIEFGLSGTNSGITVSALASFPVTLTLAFASRTLTASTVISVPVNAGIL